MENVFHKELLQLIISNSGKGTQHTLNDSYLGNKHPRIPITAPVLRNIAKKWSIQHRGLTSQEVVQVLTSLIRGESSTEKIFAGMLLDYTTPTQKNFHPKVFNSWLNHVEGWAEVDALCTGKYTLTHVILNLEYFETWIPKLS